MFCDILSYNLPCVCARGRSHTHTGILFKEFLNCWLTDDPPSSLYFIGSLGWVNHFWKLCLLVHCVTRIPFRNCHCVYSLYLLHFFFSPSLSLSLSSLSLSFNFHFKSGKLQKALKTPKCHLLISGLYGSFLNWLHYTCYFFFLSSFNFSPFKISKTSDHFGDYQTSLINFRALQFVFQVVLSARVPTGNTGHILIRMF